MQRIFITEAVGKVGEQVLLKGWVHVRRNMGKMVFIDLRDRTGLMQVVIAPANVEEASVAAAKAMRPEFVVAVTGTVQRRKSGSENPKLATGTVEVLASKVEIISEAKTPPFEIDNEERQAAEELRLKYRYLDLRHERLQKNLTLRHEVILFMRKYLAERGFREIETPILSKSTPEGARDYLVPSRLYHGKFYALPQSPQQYKQLLMVAGIERYFQIARCFRDEDTRGDRQPEFTQLDLEMSFVEREDVMALNEELLVSIVKTLAPEKRIQQVPFPRLSYKEAMEKYGTDRPDLREDKNDPNLLAFVWIIDFPFFEKTDDPSTIRQAHGGDQGRTTGSGWTFTHNPFSAPKPEFVEDLLARQNIGGILTSQYDVVLNGWEIGGGSIRNHRADALQAVFEIMGHKLEDIKHNFGHMLEAFSYGVPPHGGIAWGMDRLFMVLAGEPNIREVIAFPKTADAKDLLMGAPDVVTDEQLADLGLQYRGE